MFVSPSQSQDAGATHAQTASLHRSALARWIARHPIIAYLVLAYAVTWTIFLVPLLSREGLSALPYDTPPAQVFILLAATLGLAGSAFVVTAIADGRPGVRALASRLVRWRVGVQWYLVAIFGLLVIALVAATLQYGAAPIQALLRQPSLLLAYLFQIALVTALVNLWEETGWTGFMFTRLQPRVGALGASLLVAPCFGGIHLPLLFIIGGLNDTRFPSSMYPLVILELLVLFSVPVRVIAAWLYNNTRGSVLLLGIFHASLGATAGSALLPYIVPKGTNLAITVYGAIAVVALLLVILTRGRLSYTRQPAATEPAPVTA